MNQDSSLEVRIQNSIRLDQGSSLEDIVSQIQPLCRRLLCVINGIQFHYYDKSSSIPTNVRFDYKQSSNNGTKYYFRDDNEVMYCVFGREAAIVFYPLLDIVDCDELSLEAKKKVPIIRPVKRESMREDSCSNITIIDGATKLLFPNTNYHINVTRLS